VHIQIERPTGSQHESQEFARYSNYFAECSSPKRWVRKDVGARAVLEEMEAVPCGTKEKDLTGLGTVWASAGITYVNSDKKLCPHICSAPTKWNIISGPQIRNTAKYRQLVTKLNSKSKKTACS